MTLQYILSGGQLQIDKTAFTCELLLPGSPIKKLLGTENDDMGGRPKLTKSGDRVEIDFNGSAGIVLDEGFYELFRHLKVKYREKLKGRVVIRITALSSYHVVLNMNNEEDNVIYE